jgi:hypothetical protein
MTTPSSLKTHQMKRTRKHFRSGSSCGRGSAALDYPMLTAGCVLANLHHRRIVPLMERTLRIFEMHKDADPVALAQSRLMPDLLPREYAATWARRAIDLRAARSDGTAL